MIEVAEVATLSVKGSAVTVIVKVTFAEFLIPPPFVTAGAKVRT